MSKLLIRRKKFETKNRLQQFYENLEEWVYYWRMNPHRFITEYLGLRLYGDFQKILIYMMNFYPQFIYISSRGLGKSSLTLLFCLVRCILYPGQKIIVVAPNKKQSKLFIKKVYEFKRISANLNAEIEDIKTGDNDCIISFHNGSEIQAAVCSENSRGIRCHILIVDEFALADQELLNKVFLPCLTNQRDPYYFSKPEYADLSKEKNKQIYLSSIRGEEEWSYKFFLEFVNNMLNGDMDYGTLSLPYQFGVEAGVIGADFVKQYMKNTVDSPEIAMAELECIPIGGTENAFYKYKSLNECRDNANALIAMSDLEYIEYKDKIEKWKFYKNKLPNEIRVMGVDIALIESPDNDNTAIWITRLIPNGGKYKKIVSYCESMHGLNSIVQNLRIKQLFYEMQCDYIAMDVQGNAAGIFDVATNETYDEARDIIYPAWTVNEIDDLKYLNRTYSANAVPIIKCVRTPPELLYKMIVYAKNLFDSKEVSLLIDPQEAVEYLNEKYNYYKIDDAELRSRVLNSYAQTTVFINEAINLEQYIQGGFIKLREKSGKRKDRVMAIVYMLYYVKELEEKLEEDVEIDLCDYIFSY